MLGQLALVLIIFAVIVVLFIVPQMRHWRHIRPPRSRSTGQTSSRPGSIGYHVTSPELYERERQARNNRPYRIEDIPADVDRLTLFRHYWEFRGEAVARAQCYPGLRSRDDCLGRHAPAPYYPHIGAIWSWEGENSDLDNAGLEAEARNRLNQMLAVLEQNGWRSSSHDPALDLYQLYRD